MPTALRLDLRGRQPVSKELHPFKTTTFVYARPGDFIYQNLLVSAISLNVACHDLSNCIPTTIHF